jgi:predicted nucleic acid-binding protein
VVGQAWRDSRVQVALARFLRIDEVEIVALDEQLARACGELCGAAGVADVIDASVVIIARERGDHVVTGDPHDIGRLDPACPIIPI